MTSGARQYVKTCQEKKQAIILQSLQRRTFCVRSMCTLSKLQQLRVGPSVKPTQQQGNLSEPGFIDSRLYNRKKSMQQERLVEPVSCFLLPVRRGTLRTNQMGVSRSLRTANWPCNVLSKEQTNLPTQKISEVSATILQDHVVAPHPLRPSGSPKRLVTTLAKPCPHHVNRIIT